MQLEITHICSVRIEVLCLISETSQLNTHNRKYCEETKQRAQWRPVARTRENHNKDHDDKDTFSTEVAYLSC